MVIHPNELFTFVVLRVEYEQLSNTFKMEDDIMNRIRKFTVIAVALLVLAIPLTALAQAVTYTAGFQLQNLTGTTANVVISYYNQDGTTAATVNDTINANSSKTYFPLSAVANGFNGSVVVSSDQQVAAIVNVLGNNGQRGAAYGGFNAGATTSNLPLIMKNNFGIDTWFNVQNAGSSAATVNVSYKPGTCTESQSIAPNAAKTFTQSSNTCLPSGFVGAATVTSAQPIVVTVMQADSRSLLAYNGFTTASTNPVMPLVTSRFFNSGTGIQIQNTGGTNTDVTLTYTPSAGFPGSTCTETRTVVAGASSTFSFPDLPAGCGASFVGAARVTGNTANMPLVAIVNQITRGTATAAAYNAVNPANATNRVSLPLIMDRNFGIFTGFSVANVGTQPTNVSCTFTGTSYTASATNVQPGAALTDVQLNRIASGYVGSATCTATGGDAKIAGIVNELTSGAPTTTDALLVYDAFNY